MRTERTTLPMTLIYLMPLSRDTSEEFLEVFMREGDLGLRPRDRMPFADKKR
jgi:hypothetical protein